MKRIGMVAWALLLCLLCCLPSCSGVPSDAPLTVRFLDVGQGDCTLLQCDEGYILIDSGPISNERALFDRLCELGVRELLLAVFTHTDADHIGGAERILCEIPIREVWVPIKARESEDEVERYFWKALKENGHKVTVVRAGEVRTYGDVTVSVLSPFPFSLGMKEEDNANSIVTRVTCGDATVLFTGDMTAETEKRLLSCYGSEALRAQLYKVGHHGSSDASSAVFLEAIDPDYAVIFCGDGNSYGHPHGEVLDRLDALGIECFRTDLSGEIVFYSDGERFFPVE